MNARGAIRASLQFAFDAGMDQAPVGDPSTSYEHLISLEQRILNADNAGSPYSETKINRWLGWIQGSIVANQFAHLDDMKDINRSFAD